MHVFGRLVVFFALGIAGLLILAFALKILAAAVILAGLAFAGIFVYTAVRQVLRRRQAVATRPY